MEKNLKRYLPLWIAFMVGAGICGIRGLLGGYGIFRFSKSEGAPAVRVQNDGLVVVNATAVAREEFTQMTQISARPHRST
ncbi:MAG: hypothetical protein JXA13_01235 [Anaerolineales bacterium]|nr:hypothetical protein [Anaerolineales bacterium]